MSTPSTSTSGLNQEELNRYGRHLHLPGVGAEGQRKLKQARVLIVGAGGLGSPVGLYLAAAGVGHVGLVDYDLVETSNLQRQIIHGTRDVGYAKVSSAAGRMEELNPHVRVETFETRLTRHNALTLLRDYDVVVDGTDNFPTRYLLNDACVLLGKPNVHGSVFRFEGQASVFAAAGGPCYRCLYPFPPAPGTVQNCAEGGVLGVLPGLLGTIQATETIKLILGLGETLVGRLLLVDALSMKFRELAIRRDPACPICSEQPTIKELADYESFCGLPVPPVRASGPEEVTTAELRAWLAEGRDIQIVDVREPVEYEVSRLPGSVLIPLGQVVNRRAEFDPARVVVVQCRSGIRSAKAIEQLRASGYTGRLLNLTGGILAW